MFRIILPTADIEQAIDQHPTLLKSTTFRKGNHKGAKRVFAIYDLKFDGEYGPAMDHPTVEGAKVQVAKDLQYLGENLPHTPEDYQPIPVRLACGVTLQIRPYTDEPCAVIFSTKTVGAPTSPYGRRAMEFAEHYEKLAAEGTGTYAIADWLDLVTYALQASYPTLPLAFWDAAGLVATSDLERILLACVGCDPSFLEAGATRSGSPA